MLILLFASCSGSSSSSNKQSTVSNLSNRVFVTNTFSGLLQIVDAQKDVRSTFTIQMGGSPTLLYVSQDLSTVLGFDSKNNTIDVVDTPTEQRLASISTGGFTDSFLSTNDGKTGYVAVRNALIDNTIPGVIEVLDLRTNRVITSWIPIPNVRYLAANHAVTKLLAFSDTSDDAYLIDPTTAIAGSNPAPTKLNVPLGTFSRPVAAYFSADDTKAYILSCGPECGGTQARVTEWTIATGATRSVNVDAARVATLQDTTLWVTGSPNGAGGIIQKVDIGAMTATPSVAIGPGTHTTIKSDGAKLWVGAQNCGSLGCLSIYDPSSGNVKIDTQPVGLTRGLVTSIITVPHRDVMYVIEGGELRIYGIATSDLTPLQIDIVGSAYAAVAGSN